MQNVCAIIFPSTIHRFQNGASQCKINLFYLHFSSFIFLPVIFFSYFSGFCAKIKCVLVYWIRRVKNVIRQTCHKMSWKANGWRRKAWSLAQWICAKRGILHEATACGGYKMDSLEWHRRTYSAYRLLVQNRKWIDLRCCRRITLGYKCKRNLWRKQSDIDFEVVQ